MRERSRRRSAEDQWAERFDAVLLVDLDHLGWVERRGGGGEAVGQFFQYRLEVAADQHSEEPVGVLIGFADVMPGPCGLFLN